MNELKINVQKKMSKINKDIYGHFSENIGRNIYGGLYVGENSSIPAIGGVRRDIIDALKAINIPALRWPGGCYGDTYHWKNGIGPKKNRPTTINAIWGEVEDNNHFGTHEFLELCERLGCDAYLNCNIGTGSVQETREWVEYVNCDKNSDLVKTRRSNGREKPWNVKYFGIGNENWGAGGKMSADYYTSLYNNHQNYVYAYGNNVPYKIAGGPSYSSIELPDYLSHDVSEWIESLMKRARYDMDGLSIHYYIMPGNNWDDKGSALDFDENEWFITMKKTLLMDDYIRDALSIMDKHDPDKTVDLIIDEWGTFYKCEWGKSESRYWGYDGELMAFQQNSLRDALVAGTILNTFNKHSDRLKMANLSMTVNQLQSLFITDGSQLIKTPTYQVFKMYKDHQDAELLETELKCDYYQANGEKLPSINVSASSGQDGVVTLSICNLDLNERKILECEIENGKPENISGEVLTASKMNSHNTFEKPEAVVSKEFTEVAISGNNIKIDLQPKSVTVLKLKLA